MRTSPRSTGSPRGTESGPVGSRVSGGDLAFIERLVEERIAVQLGGKAYLVESRLAPIVRSRVLTGIGQLVDRLRAGTDVDLESEVLDRLTTNETSFFRDRHPFDALATELIPQLLTIDRGDRPLTIWSGAGSSGQEALSLAMMIREHFPRLARRGRVRIISSDVSPSMVERSRRALYSDLDVRRGLTGAMLERYFERAGRDWVASSRLTDLIEVRLLNLVGPWSRIPRCDLVLLRNVLIYFPPEVRAQILRRIRTDVLAPHGYLLLGASESTVGIDDGFASRRVGDTIVFVPTADHH